MIQIEGTEIEDSLNGDIGFLTPNDFCHSVHIPETRFEPVEPLAIDKICLVQNKNVCKCDLFGALIASTELLVNMSGIDEGDDSVKCELRTYLVIHKKSLCNRTWISKPGGFNQNIIKLIPALHEVA